MARNIAEVIHYFDYKSPYAYLAQEATDALETDFGVAVRRVPYTLDIPSFLGAARLDDAGRVVMNERSDHQWRRVRYAYMDCRREATRRGLVVRGPRKIWDTSIAHIGFLFASHTGSARRYHDTLYAHFWRHEIDVEDVGAIGALLAESGIDASGFTAYLAGSGRIEHDRLQREAEDAGVFGVPSWRVDGELFWGSERIERVREAVAERGG